MAEQLIISLSREYGSGGHTIANILSKHFSIPIYDYNLLMEIAAKKDVNVEDLKKYDEVPKSSFFSRNVRGYTNSPVINVANMQFDYLREKAKSGESFIVIGRCSETVLRDYPSMVSIFILADMADKIKRISKLENVSESDAEQLIDVTNKKRKEYHDYFCTSKWGDSRNYDISINSSKLGDDATAKILIEFIEEKIKMNKA